MHKSQLVYGNYIGFLSHTSTRQWIRLVYLLLDKGTEITKQTRPVFCLLRTCSISVTGYRAIQILMAPVSISSEILVQECRRQREKLRAQ